jgi:hypothetical protein
MATAKKTPAKKKTATAPDNLWKALGRFAMKMPILHQGTKAHSYTYTDLKTIVETAVPIAYNEGLVWNYKLQGNGLLTRLVHMETGEVDESFVELPEVELRGMNSVQSRGAVITYFKRYSISCLLNLVDSSDIDVQGEVKKLSKEPQKTLKIINDKDFDRFLENRNKESNGVFIDDEWLLSRFVLNPQQQQKLKEVQNGE